MSDFVSRVPPHEPSEEVLASAGKTLLSLVPGVGGVLAEVLASGMQIRQSERQDAFNRQIGRAVDDLFARSDDSLRPEDVLASEEFLAAVSRSSRIAAETASAAKRQRLATATASAGSWASIAPQERSQFARLVETLDDFHVWLLHYLADPHGWLVAHDFASPSPEPAPGDIRIPESSPAHMTGDDSPLGRVFGRPWAEFWPTFAHAVGELERAGLVDNPLRDQIRRLWPAMNARTNQKGRRFLIFVGEPPSVTADVPEDI